MAEISIIVPCFNEEHALAKFLPTLNKELLSCCKVAYEIIVVDDGSKDNSAEVIKKFKYAKLIKHPENIGYGAALKTGIRNCSGKWILIIDSDGTYNPNEIKRLLNKRKNYDMIIGARTGKNVHIPLLRKPAKLFLKLLSEYVTGKKIPDLNSGLRLFRKNMCYDFWKLYPQGFSFTSTITIGAMSNGYRIKFIPINYLKRIGKSSINPIKDFIGFTRLILKLMLFFRPLKIFLPISIFFFALSTITIMHNYYFFSKIVYDLTILFSFFIGMNTLMLGLIAEMISKR